MKMMHAAFFALWTLAQAPAAMPGQAAPASEASAKPLPSGPVVVLDTSLGAIKLVLNKEKAPITVENFLKYVRARHYDGLVFHRVIQNFMIQGGGYDSALVEKPTREPIKNEASNGLRNSRGTIAMARTNAPNSATSQFFINLKENARLDYGIGGAGYAVFGEVVEGMDVVDKIAAVTTTLKSGKDPKTGQEIPMQDVPFVSVVIKSAREVAVPAPAPAASPKPVASPGKP
jgi:peptidyl-prolyl cis-trans isomerase A (cyclophilin A)